MQTMVDVADNTGAKRAMVFNVYKGSTARHGKKRLKTAKVGDIVLVAVKKAMPNSDFSGGSDRKDRSKRRKARAVVVRTKNPTRRADGSYVRFDTNAVVLIDEKSNDRKPAFGVFRTHDESVLGFGNRQTHRLWNISPKPVLIS